MSEFNILKGVFLVGNYRVIVNMTPYPDRNPKEPFFWTIMNHHKDHNESIIKSGWAATPLKAFNAATRYLNTL